MSQKDDMRISPVKMSIRSDVSGYYLIAELMMDGEDKKLPVGTFSRYVDTCFPGSEKAWTDAMHAIVANASKALFPDCEVIKVGKYSESEMN